MDTIINRESDMFHKANSFYRLMSERRTVRHFTSKDIPLHIIQECVKTAGTAPSGANKQPWFFAIIKSQEMKTKIRIAAEKEEYDFYHKRNNEKWLDDLKPFRTNWKKPHLEEASTLIVIFSKNFEDTTNQNRCYYSKESVGIATGMLITALHQLGISTLTHTPNPMSFLNELLNRPKNEKPYLILATGYKNDKFDLPDIKRKNIEEISAVF